MIAIRNILVPTDFSEPADAAFEYAQALAGEFGSRVHLLHVVPEPYVYPWGTELSTMPLAEVLAQSEQAARTRLAEIVAAAKSLAGRVQGDAAIGTPVDRILAYVADHDIDLIVIGTHGRGMVGHLLLGSVAERVVRRSPVPVLTIHGAPKAVKAAGADRAAS
jgi:nucleotide-binding universal stress UspA family protein